MSRARHHEKHKKHEKHRASGGEAEVGNPHVFALAKEKTIGTIGGGKTHDRLDRKHGGGVKAKKRSHGGAAGSDQRPYSSAHYKHGGKVHEHHKEHEKEHHRGRE